MKLAEQLLALHEASNPDVKERDYLETRTDLLGDKVDDLISDIKREKGADVKKLQNLLGALRKPIRKLVEIIELRDNLRKFNKSDYSKLKKLYVDMASLSRDINKVAITSDDTISKKHRNFVKEIVDYVSDIGPIFSRLDKIVKQSDN